MPTIIFHGHRITFPDGLEVHLSEDALDLRWPARMPVKASEPEPPDLPPEPRATTLFYSSQLADYNELCAKAIKLLRNGPLSARMLSRHMFTRAQFSKLSSGVVRSLYKRMIADGVIIQLPAEIGHHAVYALPDKPAAP